MSDATQDEQIPIQFVIEELQATTNRQSGELLLARAQLRQRDDTIRQLQQHSADLQRRLTEYEDRVGE